MALFKRFTKMKASAPQVVTPSPVPHPQQQGKHQGPAEIFDVDDDFLEGLVWNEDTVSQGVAPERRSSHPPSRRQQDANQQSMSQEAYNAQVDQAYQSGYQNGRAEGFPVGKEEGAKAGYDEGLARGLEEAKEASQAIWSILDQLDTAKSQVLEKSIQGIVPMAMAIAQRLLHTEVTCDRTLVVAIAKDVLSKIDRLQKEVVFKVHPDDVQRLRQDIEDNEDIWMGEVKRNIIVVGDEDVEMGSVISETSGGQIDASFSTQLNMMRKILGLPETKEAPALTGAEEFAHLLEPNGSDSPEDWETPYDEGEA